MLAKPDQKPLLQQESIKTALLHATAYCGIPAGLDAFRAAHEVLVGDDALSKPGTPAR